MSTTKTVSLPLAALLIASFSVSETQAQRRGIGPSMGRGIGAPGISRSPGFSRTQGLSIGTGLSRSNIGPSPLRSGPSASFGRSIGPNRYAPGSLYTARRPSSGLSISIGGGLSPALRYGTLSRGYGIGYSGYPSFYGRYSNGFGPTPFLATPFVSPGVFYPPRPSFGLSIYSDPLINNQRSLERYSASSSTYRYTQPTAPLPSTAYQTYREPTLQRQPRDNTYTGQAVVPSQATGDPSDPTTELRAGMILPDGSRVISVGTVPAAATRPQPSELTPAQPAPTPPPIESTGSSVLQKPSTESAPAPAKIDPAKEEVEDAPEELPLGNAVEAEDV